MKWLKYNQLVVLAVLATSLMAGVIYTVDWPQDRQMASTQDNSVNK